MGIRGGRAPQVEVTVTEDSTAITALAMTTSFPSNTYGGVQGATRQLTATATFDDGTTMALLSPLVAAHLGGWIAVELLLAFTSSFPDAIAVRASPHTPGRGRDARLQWCHIWEGGTRGAPAAVPYRTARWAGRPHVVQRLKRICGRALPVPRAR